MLTLWDRWIGGCGGGVGQAVGWGAGGVHIHFGAGLFEGEGEAGCTGLYAVEWTGGGGVGDW